MLQKHKSIHGEWSSRWAFILAATGAAVGLGNIWKFPYIAGENGGGAFVLVYLICIAALGVPIMIAEIVLGRYGRQNPANAMMTAAKESKRLSVWGLVGGLTILAGFLILSYYSVVAGWALDYVFQAAAGHFNNASPEHIQFLFDDLVSRPERLVIWHSLIMACTIFVIVFGVEHGIERAVRYLFPGMLAILLVMVVYSIDTGYFGHGISFLFKPNFDALTANSILIALGHAFFTLSLATGSIMMYGAYLPQEASIPKATLFIAITDTMVALIAGLAIFPIVFANGLEPGAGPGLIFKTLPIAFGHMPYGQLFATLFFTMLVFAAFTSAISLLEPTVAWLVENSSMSRRRVTLIIGGLVWFIGLGSVASFNIGAEYKLFGKNFFDLLDYITANIMLPLGGLLISIFVAWRFRKQIILDEFNLKTTNFMYWAWHYCLGIIAPILIVIVFLQVMGYL